MNETGLAIRFATVFTALVMLTGCLQPLASSIPTSTSTPTLSLTEQLGTAVAVVQMATALAVTPTSTLPPTPTAKMAATTPMPLSIPTYTFGPTSTPDPPSTPAAANTPARPDHGKILEVCGNDLCVSDEHGNYTPLGLADQYANYDGTSWSPDGLRIVFAACYFKEFTKFDCKDLFTVNVDGSDARPVVRNPSTDIRLPAWSPNGEWIAYVENCGLSLIRPDGTGRRAILTAAGKYCLSGIAWAPDSQHLAVLKADFDLPHLATQSVNTVWVVNRAYNGEVRSIFQSGDVQLVAERITWSPDGQSVAVRLENDTSYLIKADGRGEPVETAPIPDSWYPWYWPQWGVSPGQEGTRR